MAIATTSLAILACSLIRPGIHSRASPARILLEIFRHKSAGPATPTDSTGPTNITVGLDGAGDFATLQGASDWIPYRTILSIESSGFLPGVYHDNTCFLQNRRFVTVTGRCSRIVMMCNSCVPVPITHRHPQETELTLIVGSNDDDFRNFTFGQTACLSPANSNANSLNNYAGLVCRPAAGAHYHLRDRMVFDNVIIKGGQDTYYATGSGYFP